jgi:hypothetical protein
MPSDVAIGEHRLLLAGLVAADLAQVDAGGLRKLGLREPQLVPAGPDHLAKPLHVAESTAFESGSAD